MHEYIKTKYLGGLKIMGTTINFADIFKSGFLRQAGSTLSIMDVFLTIGVTFLLSLFIFIIYKKTFQGILYTRSFNVSLVILSLVTSLVIMAISSNIVLSLGMVGALSIVRFRTAIKDPMDIVFMFWAISVGILSGAGLFLIAISGSFFIGVILLLFARVVPLDKPYLLVVSLASSLAEPQVMDLTKKAVRRYSLKSKTVSPTSVELTLEFRLTRSIASFVTKISELPGINSAILVSYNGDYAT